MQLVQHLAQKLSFGLLLLALLVPSAFAATLIERTDIFEDQVSPYTDVEVPTRPSTGGDEDYYADLGTLMFSQPMFNGMLALEGYEASNGTRYYDSDKNLNRAEAAKFFAAFNPVFAPHISSLYITSDCFTDLVNDTPWYKMYACFLKEQEVISGYSDGSYGGANTLNNAEIMKFLVKGYGLDEYSDVDVTESNYDIWYEGYQTVLEDLNVIPDNLDASGNPTRGQMASYIMRAFVVDDLATGEAFSDYQLMLFMEEKMDESGMEPLQGFIYEPSDELYILSVNPEIPNEFVTFQNGSSSEMDLGGYYVRFWSEQGFSNYQPSEVEYVFPEGTMVEAGGTISVYSQEGDHVLEGGENRYGDGGLVDKTYGTYAYVLYSPTHTLVDVLGFTAQ